MRIDSLIRIDCFILWGMNGIMGVMGKKIDHFYKVKKKEAGLIDQKTKQIRIYNLPTKVLSISYMSLEGRHPEGKKVMLEKDCSFVMYVTQGTGNYEINGERIAVEKGDAVFVRAGSTFVAEGNFEYVTVVVPAFYPETTEEIEG